MNIVDATVQGCKPLVGFYGESSTGKTFSSLLFARGFCGPAGKIVLLDTESGRGSMYANEIPGGYKTLQLSSPFHPHRYGEAIAEIEKSGAAIGIIDSVSHAWEGVGGVLDMAATNEEKSGKPGLHNWNKPKMEHGRMVLQLLQSPIPWIVCVRAKRKTRQEKDDKGRTVIVKDEDSSPIQDSGFIYEMTVYGEINHDHQFSLVKKLHRSLADCFPSGQPITAEHGAAMARWCATGGETPKSCPASDPVKELKAQLWALLAPVRGPAVNWIQAQQWLWDECCLDPSEAVARLDAKTLAAVIAAAAKKIALQFPRK